jgi:hypothetical protein
MAITKPTDRLDASESIFFEKELRRLDPLAYNVLLEGLKGRALIPKAVNLSPTDETYVYRQFETYGKARIIAPGSKDWPMVEVQGREFTARVKPNGIAFSYSLDEIRKAAEVGRPLDETKATGARRAHEELIDNQLAFGDVDNGMTGFVNHPSVPTFTFPNAGAWNTLTGPQIAKNINALINDIWTKMKEAEGMQTSVTVAMPLEQYALIDTLEMDAASPNMTVLKYVRQNERLASVVPWSKLDGAGAASADRVIGYVRDNRVCSALIGEEFTRHAPQQIMLDFVVPTTTRSGGTVIRYPIAMRYADTAAMA